MGTAWSSRAKRKRIEEEEEKEHSAAIERHIQRHDFQRFASTTLSGIEKAATNKDYKQMVSLGLTFVNDPRLMTPELLVWTFENQTEFTNDTLLLIGGYAYDRGDDDYYAGGVIPSKSMVSIDYYIGIAFIRLGRLCLVDYFLLRVLNCHPYDLSELDAGEIEYEILTNAYTALINLQLNMRSEYETALSVCNHAVDDFPKHASFVIRRSECYNALGLLGPCLDDLRASLRMKVTPEQVQYVTGAIRLVEQQSKSAETIVVRTRVSDWNAEQVHKWTAGFGLSYSAVADRFRLKGIDGQILLTLTDALLIELGVDDSVFRHVLLEKIKLCY